MGKLIEEIIEPYASKKGKGTINWIPLKQIALQMQDTIPQNRKSVTEVINEPFFNNNVIIEVLEILRNYKIKDENSKKQILRYIYLIFYIYLFIIIIIIIIIFYFFF